MLVNLYIVLTCSFDVEAVAKVCSPDHKTSLEAENFSSWNSPEKQKSDWEVSELLKTALDAVHKLQVS